MTGVDLSQLPQGDGLRQQVIEGGWHQHPQLNTILPPPDPKDAGFAERFADAEARVRAQYANMMQMDEAKRDEVTRARLQLVTWCGYAKQYICDPVTKRMVDWAMEAEKAVWERVFPQLVACCYNYLRTTATRGTALAEGEELGNAGEAKEPKVAGPLRKRSGGQQPAKQPAKPARGGQTARAREKEAAKMDAALYTVVAAHHELAGDQLDEEPAVAGGGMLAAGFPAVMGPNDQFPAVMRQNDHYRLPEQILIDIAIDENTAKECAFEPAGLEHANYFSGYETDIFRMERIPCVVDSGARVNPHLLLSTSFMGAMFPKSKILSWIQPPASNQLSAAEGGAMKILGELQVLVRIASPRIAGEPAVGEGGEMTRYRVRAAIIKMAPRAILTSSFLALTEARLSYANSEEPAYVELPLLDAKRIRYTWHDAASILPAHTRLNTTGAMEIQHRSYSFQPANQVAGHQGEDLGDPRGFWPGSLRRPNQGGQAEPRPRTTRPTEHLEDGEQLAYTPEAD